MMVVYFAVIGGLFYKMFIKSPYEKTAVENTDTLLIANEQTGNIHV